jgi:integrase/recombinase XerD
MTLLPAIEAYIRLKRSLGAVFSSDARILQSFGRRLGDIPLHTISSETCHAFCRGPGPPTRFWERKSVTLHGFFTYLVGRGHLTASPLCEPHPRVRRTFQPYIFSLVELQRLLDATTTLASNRCPLNPLTFRSLLLVLYGAGLRPGEALRLRCCDVDLPNRLLAIWDTKFFKSRLVPIGTQLTHHLKLYRYERKSLPLPDGDRSAFFATPTGTPIPLGKLERVFSRLRRQAGLRRPATERWQPRLHDLRHAFAVHRLIAWYRAGANVQAMLPLLATYLGHLNVSGTQAYLTMTPELLAEASHRFEGYASVTKEDTHE